MKKKVIVSCFKIISIMFLCTIISLFFRREGFNESNIIIVFILGVLFTSKYTEGYTYGIFASIIGVLVFNFFFTSPYYTFFVHSPDYIVTFIIMLISAVITSTLTSKVKREAKIAKIREKNIKLLYRINKGLLKSKNVNQIIGFCGSTLAKMLNRSVVIVLVDSKLNFKDFNIYEGSKRDKYIFNLITEKKAMLESIKSFKPVGKGTNILNNGSAYYQPIIGENFVLGLIGVVCLGESILSSNDKILLEAVSAQITLAVEREYLFEKQKKLNIEKEREKLRSNLLRSISHDFRTPLTGILGSVTTIIDNDDYLDKLTRNELLQNIFEDTTWIVRSVENILSMTRIDEGMLNIKNKPELVEEIISGVIEKFKRNSKNHEIKINIPDKPIIITVDGLLIQQVLVNLIDNAIKYTPNNSTIYIKVIEKNNSIVFQVSDNGKGIAKEDISNIFNRFYTSSNPRNLEKRGTGLGLAICKSIILAHNGSLDVYNNDFGGATFSFTIPLRE